MREIIFRGKRIDNGEWVEGGLISIDLETYDAAEKIKYTHCIVEPNVEFYRGEIGGFEFVNPETVGQFTGLTDRNGKRIFEGDIIRKGFECFAVKWNSNQCRWGLFDKHYFEVVGFNEHTKNYLEIIGNIYDNPELLNEINEREGRE